MKSPITQFTLPQLQHAAGTVVLPGSKSISNRVLLLAALSQGTTRIQGLLESDDTHIMLQALQQLGIVITQDGGDYVVHGQATFPVKQAELFLGNAGTALRPLTAVLALSQGHYQIDGVARMRERPIGDLVEALQQLSCQIEYMGNPGYPPLAISPASYRCDQAIRISGAVSSQFLTALLMAAPLLARQLQHDIQIEVEGELISKPYILLTMNLMQRFGVHVEHQDWQRFTIRQQAQYRSVDCIQVEGDASSASYFMALGLLGQGPLTIQGVGKDSIQGDIQFAQLIEHMGGELSWGEQSVTVRHAKGPLKAFDMDFNLIPDAAMTAAVLALFADDVCVLRHIGSWRVKETDRIAAMQAELERLGATVESGPDWLRVHPLTHWQDAHIQTYDDHRMAMCFSLAAFGSSQVTILDPECVAKTFPNYFTEYTQVTQSPHSEYPVITIDGPSASGKGTIARLLAQRLGFRTLDSGALYRLVALQSLRQGVAVSDEVALVDIAQHLDVTFEGDNILLNAEVVNQDLMTEETAARASQIAMNPQVRHMLLHCQRAFSTPQGLVADGRDMGSVVFSHASLKIYLEADLPIRAERRFKQLKDKAINAKIENIFEELSVRDQRDKNRLVAPLKPSAYAYTVDSSNITVTECVDIITQLWHRQQSSR